MSRRSRIPSLGLSLLALASCAGEEEAPIMGLPEDARLADLTLEQANAGCDLLQALVDRRFRSQTSTREQCTLLALDSTTDETTCEVRRNSCEQTAPEEPPRAGSRLLEPPRRLGCEDPAQLWRGCGATVGALERCLRDLLRELRSSADDFTCRDAPTYLTACLPPLTPLVAVDEIDPRTNMPPRCELVPLSEACWALQDECTSLPLQ